MERKQNFLNAKPHTSLNGEDSNKSTVWLKTGYDKEKKLWPYVRTTLFMKKKPTEQGFILRSIRYGIKQWKKSNTRKVSFRR
jgi:hypothetical protein